MIRDFGVRVNQIRAPRGNRRAVFGLKSAGLFMLAIWLAHGSAQAL